MSGGNEKNESQELAQRFCTLFLQLFRLQRLYDVDNVNLAEPLNKIQAVTAQLVARYGSVRIQSEEGMIFFGSVSSAQASAPWATEEKTYHEAVTVSKGIKHAANFWIHMFEFQQMLQNGCDNQDYFQYNLMDKDGKVRRPRKDVGPR